MYDMVGTKLLKTSSAITVSQASLRLLPPSLLALFNLSSSMLHDNNNAKPEPSPTLCAPCTYQGHYGPRMPVQQ